MSKRVTDEANRNGACRSRHDSLSCRGAEGNASNLRKSGRKPGRPVSISADEAFSNCGGVGAGSIAAHRRAARSGPRAVDLVLLRWLS
jgi:hypothetical protein